MHLEPLCTNGQMQSVDNGCEVNIFERLKRPQVRLPCLCTFYSFVYLSLISLCLVGNFLSTHPVNESGCPLSWFTIDLFVYIS